MTQGFHGPWNFKSPGKETKKIITCSTELKTSFTQGKTLVSTLDTWILFTVGNVDRDIGRYSGRYSGRHSVDSRLTLGR